MFVFILFAPCLYSWEIGYEKPFIFVDSVDEIPKSLSQREAYFRVLLDYQKTLVEGFKGYLEMLYGDILSSTYMQWDERTEAIKDDFYIQEEIIQYAGLNMIIFDHFSRGELYDYSRMIERSNETLLQLFR